MRLERNPTRADLDEDFTLLAAFGATLWLIGRAAAIMLPFWTPAPNASAVAAFGMIIPQLVIHFPLAVLARNLDYAAIANIDLFHATRLSERVIGAGHGEVWAPVAAVLKPVDMTRYITDGESNV